MSVVNDYGKSNNSCGYCGDSEGFYSHGMMASTLKLEDYQDLLDIGWRRSGCYLYKPDLMTMCCPLYTIRLQADRFHPSREQRRTLKRFDRYLNGGPLYPQSEEKSTKNNVETRSDPEAMVQRAFKQVFSILVYQFLTREGIPEVLEEISVDANLPGTKKKKLKLGDSTLVSSPVSFPLFKALKSHTEIFAKYPTVQLLAHSLAELFNSTKLSLVSENPDSSVWSQILEHVVMTSKNGHLNLAMEGAELQADLIQKLDCNFVGVEDEDLSSLSASDEVWREDSTNSSDLPDQFLSATGRKREFTLTTTRSKFIEEEYELYKKYQTRVHDDPYWKISRDGYSNFLVDSPLIHNSNQPEMGSFHMQYRIDGRLIAVGVVDVLPRCLSSKYLFWDPDFAVLSLGKLSALKEIEWILSAQRRHPSLKYYYMGYYVHSCPKMRYKGNYKPSELLCPKTYRWIELNQSIRSKLDQSKYSEFGESEGIEWRANEVHSEEKGLPSIESQPILIYDKPYSLGELFQYWRRNVTSSRRNRKSVEHLELEIERFRDQVEEWRAQAMEVGARLRYVID